MPIILRLARMVLCGVAAAVASSAGAQPSLDRIKLPPGFAISLFADNLPDARSMALGAGDVLFVGTRRAGKVYAVRFSEGRATQVITLASGLNAPNGVAFKGGALYVAEVNRILRFDDVEARLDKPQTPAVVTDRFPSDEHHGWKFIRFGPDGMLYVPVGVACNICDEKDPYGTIMRMKTDGSGLEIYARGIRNTVGFDWSPGKELWFTDNGRDMLGDEVPPDELDYAPRKDMHFGFPY